MPRNRFGQPVGARHESWDGTALYTCVVPVRDDALILRRYYPTRDIGVLG